jgi:hypothetical protein
VLGVTVFCDVFVLVLFTFTSNIAHTYCIGAPFNIVALLISLGNIVAAIALGWVLGQVLIVLLWAQHPAWPYVVCFFFRFSGIDFASLPFFFSRFARLHLFSLVSHFGLALVYHTFIVRFCIGCF